MAEPTPKTSVTLTDGTVAQFNSKQKLVKTPVVTDAGEAGVRLDFVNGETRTFILPASIILRAAAHGISQKLGDAATSEDSLDDAIVSVDELIAQLSAGNWTAERKSGSNAGISVLMKALMEAFGKTQDETRAWLVGKTQAEKIALRRHDKLAPIIARLEKDKEKTSKVDTDGLLSAFTSANVAPAETKAKKSA